MTYPPAETDRRALALVEAALNLAPPDRRRYVLEQPEDEATIRRALQILGRQEENAPIVLTGGASTFIGEDATPDTVGGYRIVREIGRGGMGAVFLGRKETADFEHFAAIKIVPSDLATTRFRDRLRSERRTLARLKHANIAQFYDGGELDDGAPYFIMEYVDGEPLDAFLREPKPDISERLDIFEQVCAAVGFAHQHLIIHRDLSPANILVTNDGDVKLIDFGIAQALDADDDPAPRTTATKGYAAPERLQGAPASTITDVYSLGVILEKIVEGLTPPRANDLTAIVERARDSDPRARYQSVDALAADIWAYRNHQTVEAVQGGWVYSLARFMGRRRYAAAAAVFAIVVTLATSVIMTALYLKADAAEKQAQQRFNELRELASFMMFDHYDAVAAVPGTVPIQAKLANTSLKYLDGLRETSGASDGLRLEIARGYQRLADITGNPSRPNLGHNADAFTLLELAASETNALKRERPDDPDVLLAYVEVNRALAEIQATSRNNHAAAVKLLRELKDQTARLLENGNGTPAGRLIDAQLSISLGLSLQSLDRGDEAVGQLTDGIETLRRLIRDQPGMKAARVALAQAHTRRGEAIAWRAYFSGESYDAALPDLDAAVDALRALSETADNKAPTQLELVIALFTRANTTCYIPGRENDGLADLAEASLVLDQLTVSDGENTRVNDQRANIISQQFDCLRNLDRAKEALPIAARALELQERRIAEEPHNPELLRGKANLLWLIATTKLDSEFWKEGCETLRKTEETWAIHIKSGFPLTEFDQHQRNDEARLAAQCAAREHQ